MSRDVHLDGRTDSLTPRETEVLAGLMQGRSAKQIALAHRVNVLTIRSQIAMILRKLSVHSQLEAVAKARRDGLIDGEEGARTYA